VNNATKQRVSTLPTPDDLDRGILESVTVEQHASIVGQRIAVRVEKPERDLRGRSGTWKISGGWLAMFIRPPSVVTSLRNRFSATRLCA
jgi:hypothetical protein